MQDVSDQTVRLPAEQLAKHALHHAYEGPREESFPEAFDEDSFDLYDAHNNIVYVDEFTDGVGSASGTNGNDGSERAVADEDRTGLQIEAELSGTCTVRESRGSRMHPPEYRSESVPVRIFATWVPTDNLAPETTLRVEAAADPFAPPEPDIEAHRYDL